ncbi:MAG: hypothetical protein IPF87_13530 [Gemmatimonadetes bacterium]|nr:hypothetical protein [Gemmatimonadota bacterium]
MILHGESLRARHTARPARGLLLAVLATVSCSDRLVPLPLPEGSRQFLPEPVYRAWWAQMEACAGKRASFDAVSWYVIPGEEPIAIPHHPLRALGYWDPGDNRIVLLQFLPDRRAPVVRHEALHAITRRIDHPPEYFVTRCGAVIVGPENPYE